VPANKHICQTCGNKFVSSAPANSGADNSVPNEMIKAVSSQCTIPVVVGGGIRNPQTAREKVENGASIIVTGNYFEDENNWDASSLACANENFNSYTGTDIKLIPIPIDDFEYWDGIIEETDDGKLTILDFITTSKDGFNMYSDYVDQTIEETKKDLELLSANNLVDTKDEVRQKKNLMMNKPFEIIQSLR